MDKFFLILAIVGFISAVIPVSNYWKTLFQEEKLQSGCDLLIFSAFRLVFDISVSYLLYESIMSLDQVPSAIPFFLFAHFSVFSFSAIIIPIEYGLSCIINVIRKTRKTTEKKDNHIDGDMFTFIKRYYKHTTMSGPESLLTSEYSKIILLACYILGGFVAGSGFANDLLLHVYKNNSNIAAVLQPILINDQQLYCNVFIVSFIPIIFAYLFNTNKKE